MVYIPVPWYYYYVVTSVDMIFLVVLVTIGLLHGSNGAISNFCKTDPPSSNNGHDYFQLDVNIPSVGTYDLRTFTKLTSYNGKL